MTETREGRRLDRRPSSMFLFGIIAALAAAQASTAAITVGTKATAPALRVDASGNAEVAWTAGGRRATVLVPATGRLRTGGALVGGDVSQPVRGTHIPFQRVLRSGPGGWYYALQARRVDPNGPLELRFSRWQGVPTEVSLTATKTSQGVKLSGRVSLDEKPVLEGYVFLDALRAGAWERLGRARVSTKGSFSRAFRQSPLGSSFRAIVRGPNVGATYAPDASALVEGIVEPDLPPR